MDTPCFWLGPLGAMVPLAPPEPDISSTPEMQAASHVSLNARRTLDIQGFRRVWGLVTAHLYPDDLAYIEACYFGVIRRELRFIDPTRKNRFSLPASAMGTLAGWSGSGRTFVASAGILAERRDDPPPVQAVTSDDGRQWSYGPDTSMRWTLSASAPQTVTIEKAQPVPALGGEQVYVSGYVKVSGTVTATLTLIPQDGSGADQTPVTIGSTTSTTWVRLGAAYTPPSTVASYYLKVTTSATAGAVIMGAFQAEVGAAPTVWVPGTGCPAVAITAFSPVSKVYPLVTADLTITEL